MPKFSRDKFPIVDKFYPDSPANATSDSEIYFESRNTLIYADIVGLYEFIKLQMEGVRG